MIISFNNGSDLLIILSIKTLSITGYLLEMHLFNPFPYGAGTTPV